MRAIACLFLAFLAGCIFIYDESGSEAVETVYYEPGWDEVRVVIYREYFLCGPDVVVIINDYRDRRGYVDCDIFVLLFIARWLDVDYRIVFDTYDRCNRETYTVVTQYNISNDIFVVQVTDDVDVPPPYGKVYGYWRNRTLRSQHLTNEDYRHLMDLRLLCDYYDFKPKDVFARVKSGQNPREILIKEHKQMGKGVDVKMRKPQVHDRPWVKKPEKSKTPDILDEWEKGRKEHEKEKEEKRHEEHAKKEERRKQEEQEREKRRIEDEKRRQEEERVKREEERKRRDEEDRKRREEEDRKRREEEERKKREEEDRKKGPPEDKPGKGKGK